MYNIKKLYTKLGKLTFCYINKKINFIQYSKQAKKISNEIKDLKKEIKYKKFNDIGKEEFTKEGYGIYKFCSKCQVGNNPNAKVCINCGKRFDK